MPCKHCFNMFKSPTIQSPSRTNEGVVPDRANSECVHDQDRQMEPDGPKRVQTCQNTEAPTTRTLETLRGQGHGIPNTQTSTYVMYPAW